MYFDIDIHCTYRHNNNTCNINNDWNEHLHNDCPYTSKRSKHFTFQFTITTKDQGINFKTLTAQRLTFRQFRITV